MTGEHLANASAVEFGTDKATIVKDAAGEVEVETPRARAGQGRSVRDDARGAGAARRPCSPIAAFPTVSSLDAQRRPDGRRHDGHDHRRTPRRGDRSEVRRGQGDERRK